MIIVNCEQVSMRGTTATLMSEVGMAMSEIIEALEAEGVSREETLKMLHKSVDFAAEVIDASKEQQEEKEVEIKLDESEGFDEEKLKKIFADTIKEMIGR